MSSVVVDTSALLACVNKEPGSDLVAAQIGGALLCSVNYAETISVLIRHGATLERAREILSVWHFEVIDFDAALAETTGALIGRTARKGLSLGDRAWRDLDIGVQIQFIR